LTFISPHKLIILLNRILYFQSAFGKILCSAARQAMFYYMLFLQQPLRLAYLFYTFRQSVLSWVPIPPLQMLGSDVFLIDFLSFF